MLLHTPSTLLMHTHVITRVPIHLCKRLSANYSEPTKTYMQAQIHTCKHTFSPSRSLARSLSPSLPLSLSHNPPTQTSSREGNSSERGRGEGLCSSEPMQLLEPLARPPGHLPRKARQECLPVSYYLVYTRIICRTARLSVCLSLSLSLARAHMRASATLSRALVIPRSLSLSSSLARSRSRVTSSGPMARRLL
jgi:hypothetical protein